jgi:hypothetical protein
MAENVAFRQEEKAERKANSAKDESAGAKARAFLLVFFGTAKVVP